MHIMFFSDHLKPEPSAPAAHVYERAQFWVEWGHQVTIMGSAPNFPEGRVYPGYKNHWRFVEYPDNIRVVRVKTFIVPNEGFLLRTLDYLSYMISAFFFSLLEKKPDVVISTSGHIFTPVAGLAYAALRKIPHVFEIRDLWPAAIIGANSLQPGFTYRLLEKLELFLYRKSTRIVALTPAFIRDLVSRGIPEDKIDLVINGANLSLFTPRPADEKLRRQYGLHGRFVVGYLGTLGLSHGLENVIRAAELLQDTNVIFLLVGVGAAKKSLEKMVAERGLRNVIFTGRQEKDQMPRFWSVCDLSLIHLRASKVLSTVIPSKIFESMAMAVPIAYVGPAGEGSAIVAGHEAGIVAPPDDPHELALKIMELSKDSKRIATLRANSLKAAPNYSRERQAQRTLTALENAIKEKT